MSLTIRRLVVPDRLAVRAAVFAVDAPAA